MKKFIKWLSIVLGALVFIVLIAGVIVFRMPLPDHEIDVSGLPLNDFVEIIRDDRGVPHIYGETDMDAAYGLAYAHAEDDFLTIQKTFLPAKGMLGRLDGIRGAVLDYAVELLKSRDVAERELKNLPQEGLNIIYGYLEGLNAYAKKYPDKVLVKKSFPSSKYL